MITGSNLIRILNGLSLALVLLGGTFNVFAEESTVAILLPDVREPFRGIFDSIGQGVADGLNAEVEKYYLEDNFDKGELDAWLQNQGIGPVVALGVLGQQAALTLGTNRDLVLGALLNVPSGPVQFSGVALTPDPRALFQLLRDIEPAVERVIVVFNPKKNEWLLEAARTAAVEQRLDLQVRYASDLKQSANTYKDILDNADFEKEAIWLLQDSSVVDNKVVLPFILQKAWSRNALVFSSSLGHVKKGALFSMYPDNELHGIQLAKLLQEEKKNSKTKNIYASTGLMRAINSRTAEHLGLRINRNDLKNYDVVFPISN